MSDKNFDDLATKITIATIQRLNLEGFNVEHDTQRQFIADTIQDVYKAAMKTLKENQ